MATDDSKARLDALEAQLVALEKGPDFALQLLEGRTDPSSLQRRLSILLSAGRAQDAAALARAHAIDSRWVDRAVMAFVQSSALSEAEQAVMWASASADAITVRRCEVAFAQGTLMSLRPAQPFTKSTLVLRAHELSVPEQDLASRALSIIGPLLKEVRTRGHVENELEAMGVAAALWLSLDLGRVVAARDAAELLATRRPISYDYVRAVFAGVVQPTTDVLARLRDERPDDFEAELLRAVIQADFFGEVKQGHAAAMEAARRTGRSAEQRSAALAVAYELAQAMGPDALENVRAEAVHLPPADPIRRLLAVDALLRSGQHASARELLEQDRREEDPAWLQAYGYSLLLTGDTAGGTQCYVKAATLLPEPELIAKACDLAVKEGLFEQALPLLQRMAQLETGASSHWRMRLAFALADHGALDRAIQELERVVAELPTRTGPQRPRLALAQMYALAFEREKALIAFNSVCDTESVPPLEAVLGKALVLRSMARPKEAFAFLERYYRDFSKSGDFLGFYLSVAYGAGMDEAAERAIQQLHELQAARLLRRDILKPLTREELLNQLKRAEEGGKLAHGEILAGRMPWLLHEELLGQPAYLGWASRTQSLEWTPDDPVVRSRYCIYSTNGFGVRGLRPDQAGELDDISPPAAGSPVVIDLSSLITLNELGLLEDCAKRFSAVYYPSLYLGLATEESGRIPSVQSSQRDASQAIRRAVDAERVRVATEADESAHVSVAWESQRTQDAQPSVIGAGAVLDLLFQEGLLSDAQRARCVAVLAVGRESWRLTRGSTVLVDSSVLLALSQWRLLDAVTSCLDVRVTRRGYREISAILETLVAREGIRDRHALLWSTIRGGRFIATPTPRHGRSATEGRDRRSWSTAATAIAAAQGIALLADDRWQQAAAHGRWQEGDCTAFGTDALIAAMLKDNQISLDRATDCFICLVRWRYRFVVPPAAVLLNMAKRHREHPPGRPLRDVARYFHDCMRDPGLFSGLERTTPPSAMALRFFMTVVRTIAEFVVDALHSGAFTDDQHERLAAWVVREFLPHPPVSMGTKGLGHLAERTAEVFLQSALFRMVERDTPGRSHRFLTHVCRKLGVSESEFADISTRTILMSLSKSAEEPDR